MSNEIRGFVEILSKLMATQGMTVKVFDAKGEIRLDAFEPLNEIENPLQALCERVGALIGVALANRGMVSVSVFDGKDLALISLRR